ncbi:hypothetical protein CDV31_003084 [Fusarium ambrosium]|uniref:Uncharacterized protein n=1 Tax=Fusarium ambrosium TaxID=131363 RepID=A0A428UV67_9HYPO|nr:hypothetical protein CDV31_003084 [Fusarium ambrosium]
MTATIPHSMREKLLRNEVAYTMSVKLVKSVEIAGMAKTAGYDGILIDMEHSSFDLETTSQLCIAGLYAGISPIVRAPSKDPFFVSRILDGGALGVIVPHIRSVQDAKDVVDAAKFQPLGHRSSTNGLPHHQFRSIPAKISNPITNAATLVIPMIETLEALELVEEIAALEGVDSLLIGTNDLTAEMGIPGDYENPRVIEAYERTIVACNKHGKWVGVGGLHARLDLVEKFCKMGARWVMAATDAPLLLGAASKRGSEMAALNASIAKTTANGGVNGKANGSTTNGFTNGTAALCDRLLPACTACADLGVDCVARSQQVDLTAEDAGLTHATLNGYIECLQSRIAQLERHVQASESRRARATRRPSGAAHTLLPHDGGGHRSTDSSMPSIYTMGPAQGPSEEDSSVQDTMSAIGLLSNKAMAEPRVYSGDVLNKLAMPEVISAALAVDGHDPSRASSSQPAFVMEDHLISLNRHSTREHVSQFLKWSVFLPYIDEDRLMEQYEAVIALEVQVAHPGGLSHFNTYLAISIGIMMSPESSRLSTLALSLHAAAVKLLPRIFRSQEPLDALHCMLLLVVFSMFCPAGGSTWHLMGVTMTTCIAIGLHKDSIPQARLGRDSIYRAGSLASSIDRPFGIQDVDISVSIPTEEDVDEAALSESVKAKLNFSRHLIVHAQLISDIRNTDKTELLFSYSNLCFWREFPPNTENVASELGLPLEYLDQLACRALILMANPVRPVESDSQLYLGTWADIEADTINSCKRLIEHLYDRSGRALETGSFLDAYDVLSAAVVYVCLAQRASGMNQQGLTQIFEVVSKASIVLTQYSSRFSALGTFQQFLLTLSTKMMAGLDQTIRTQYRRAFLGICVDSSNATTSVRLVLPEMLCEHASAPKRMATSRKPWMSYGRVVSASGFPSPDFRRCPQRV